MATILFAAVGSAMGAGFGGSVLGMSGAVIGRALGAGLGQMVDRRIMGTGSEPVEVGRMDRFHLMGASEGEPIPKIWGRVRIAGQVIWASPFIEHSTTTTNGGGSGKGGRPPQSSVTQYSYSVSLALALCEGEILGVGRIWADGNEIAPTSLTWRLYRGDQSQLPDPVIEAYEGAGNAPSYRGIAYLIIEDLDLTPYGSRVPQFSFEVMRKAQGEAVAAEGLYGMQDVVRAVALIPGTGEYAYATDPVQLDAVASGANWYQEGNIANQHSLSSHSDMATALEQLDQELPKCSHVSLVVSWFGSDLRAGECDIRPKVEQNDNNGREMPWRAGGITRDQALLIPRVEGRSLYGGTPSDQSILQAVQAIKASGKSVMFYPFVLMDQLAGNGLPDPYGRAEQPALPWRGRITTTIAPGRAATTDGTSAAVAEVTAFFGEAKLSDFSISAGKVIYSGAEDWGYRRFILHYAYLCHLAGGVEAFCIGSELRGITQIRGPLHRFPAVEALCALAQDVRTILGASVKITYAADWSEYFGYHVGENVYFHLDPLWSSPEIDFIGIDNYMPLSDWRSGEDHADAAWGSIYNLDYLTANVCGGEGYEWYYDSPEGIAAQRRLPIVDGAHGEDWVFRYKDLRGWWSHAHHDRIDGVRASSPTGWVAGSKPIRFTEYGCAAIDKGSNSPNLFLDPKSSESFLPRESTGLRDDFIQMQYYRAIHAYWSDPAHNPAFAGGGRMLQLEYSYAWTWDARPYPDFPRNIEAWGDGENYYRGHWINGRATAQPLAAIVTEICASAGLTGVGTETLYGLCHGYQCDEVTTPRAQLQPLTTVYGFDCVEREGRLEFISRAGRRDVDLDKERLALSATGTNALEQSRGSLPEMIGRMRFAHVTSDSSFEASVAEAIAPERSMPAVSETELPIVMPDSQARLVAERWLAESRVAQDHIKMRLPPSEVDVVAGSVIGFKGRRYRVDRLELTEAREIEALRIEPALYEGGGIELPQPLWKRPALPGPLMGLWLDLPMLRSDMIPYQPHLAVMAKPWIGEAALWTGMSDNDYRFVQSFTHTATIGQTLSVLPRAREGQMDRGPALMVKFHQGVLNAIDQQSLMNGQNVLAIGSGHPDTWEVMQVQQVELVGPETYALSMRIRGQAGTEWLIPDLWPIGSYVVLLDGSVPQIQLPREQLGMHRHYRLAWTKEGYDAPTALHEEKAFKGNGQRPYAICHLRRYHLPDESHLIRWIRRSRFDTDLWQEYEVALGDEAERYVVEVFSMTGALIRRQEVSVPEFHYPVAQREGDGALGGYQVEVSQISFAYGRGPERRLLVAG